MKKTMKTYRELLHTETFWVTKIQNDLYKAVEDYLIEHGMTRSQFADQLIVLAGGDLQAFGPPARVLDAALIERLYHVPVEISHDQSGIPFLRTVRKAS